MHIRYIKTKEMFKSNKKYRIYLSAPYNRLWKNIGYSRTLIFYDIIEREVRQHRENSDISSAVKIYIDQRYLLSIRDRLRKIRLCNEVIMCGNWRTSILCLIELLYAKIYGKKVTNYWI